MKFVIYDDLAFHSCDNASIEMCKKSGKSYRIDGKMIFDNYLDAFKKIVA